LNCRIHNSYWLNYDSNLRDSCLSMWRLLCQGSQNNTKCKQLQIYKLNMDKCKHHIYLMHYSHKIDLDMIKHIFQSFDLRNNHY
jgi:hypothetical protein